MVNPNNFILSTQPGTQEEVDPPSKCHKVEDLTLPLLMPWDQTTGMLQTGLVVASSLMLTFLRAVVDAMLLSISLECQQRTGTVVMSHPVQKITTVMPTWSVETGAQNSISWKPTPMPGTVPHISVTLQTTRVTGATAIRVDSVSRSLGNKTKELMDQEKELILTENSTLNRHSVHPTPSLLPFLKVPTLSL